MFEHFLVVGLKPSLETTIPPPGVDPKTWGNKERPINEGETLEPKILYQYPPDKQ